MAATERDEGQRHAWLENLIWVLIYGGIVLASVGWFVDDDRETLGLALQITGAVAAVIGVVLIAVRARLPGGPS